MAQPVQHKLIDEDIHRAVAGDGQPREAEYTTLYNDGSTGITRHMLYKDKKSGEVRSCPIEDWPPLEIQQLPA